MILPLSKTPRGLLELLRLRTGGKNPDEVSGTLVATIESGGFYGADLQTVTAGGPTVQAYPFASTVSMTRGGRLLGAELIVVVGAAAGTQHRLRVAYRPGAQFGGVTIAQTIVTAPAAGQIYSAFAPINPGLVFGVGAQFVFSAESDAGGADHSFQTRVLFEDYQPQ